MEDKDVERKFAEILSQIEELKLQVNGINRTIDEHVKELADNCGADGTTGEVSYEGTFASSGRQSTWGQEKVCTDSLLALVDEGLAGRVLTCVGSAERIKLIAAILRKPSSVASLVSECGFNSTGQVYHHLKPLLAADIVVEDSDSRGLYIIQPHRVQGIIMLLVGVRDLIDTTYTRGVWGE